MSAKHSTGMIAATVLLAACRPSPSPAGETIRPRTETVDQTILANAVVRPQTGAEVKVGPRVSGLLKTLHVRVGSRVRQGDLLAELDAEGFTLIVQAAQAEVDRSDAAEELAAARLRRIRTLHQGDLTSADALDEAQSLHRSTMAIARLARASLASARYTLSQTRIRAPIGGTVVSISTQQGEPVAASFAVPTFMTIVDLQRLQLEARVDEREILKVRPGQDAVATADALAEPLQARVAAVIPYALDRRDGMTTYAVILSIHGSMDDLRPDLSATIRIKTGASRRRLWIRRDALHGAQGSTGTVRVRNGDGWVEHRVTTGSATGHEVEVTSGLTGSEELLISAPSTEGTQ